VTDGPKADDPAKLYRFDGDYTEGLPWRPIAVLNRGKDVEKLLEVEGKGDRRPVRGKKAAV
jgi:hypothetical protein